MKNIREIASMMYVKSLSEKGHSPFSGYTFGLRVLSWCAWMLKVCSDLQWCTTHGSALLIDVFGVCSARKKMKTRAPQSGGCPSPIHSVTSNAIRQPSSISDTQWRSDILGL
jgi:hypothetical protein